MKKVEDDKLIGIMSVVHEGRKPFGMQTYFFEDMVKSVKTDPRDLFFFSPLDWQVGMDKISGYSFIENVWVETSRRIPEIIYDRAFAKDKQQKKHIELFRRFLKESKKRFLNPIALADLLNNKVVFHDFLQKHSIPTLGTISFNALRDVNFFDTIDDLKIYVKPTFGSKGEGIFVVEKNKQGFFLYDQLGNKKSFRFYADLLVELESEIQDHDRYFVQESAKIELFENAPFDIRVLVQNYGDKYVVTGKAVRIGQKNAVTSNLNSGGSALPLEEMIDFFEKKYTYPIRDLHHDIDTLCLECSELLRKEIGEFCEIGFDILVTKDKGPIIIEGNAKPSRWVFVKIADHLQSVGKENAFYLERRKETVSVPIKYATYLFNQLNEAINEK